MKDSNMPRADFLTSMILIVVGVATVWNSLEMPRYEDQGGTFLDSPGIVPAILGVLLVALSLVVFIRVDRPQGLPAWLEQGEPGRAREGHEDRAHAGDDRLRHRLRPGAAALAALHREHPHLRVRVHHRVRVGPRRSPSPPSGRCPCSRPSSPWPPRPRCSARSSTCSSSIFPTPEEARNGRTAHVVGGPRRLPEVGHTPLRGVGHRPGHHHRHAPRPHRHHGRGAADHAYFQDGSRQRDHHPGLHVHRRHLRRQPQRHPAEHPRDPGERRHLRGRLPPGQAGPRGHGPSASPPPARSSGP